MKALELGSRGSAWEVFMGQEPRGTEKGWPDEMR